MSMKVLITGATGLVGKHIMAQCLEERVNVHFLTTSKKKLSEDSTVKGFYWNPAKGEIDKACFEGVDYIINLAGATIAKRWTNSYKQEVLQSRINSLETLEKGLIETKTHVKSIVSASAIGVYPNSLTNYHEETEPEVDASFLGEVVVAWEKAAKNLSTYTKNLSIIRIGLVLDDEEGALPKLVQPIKLGIGAAFGNGEQWQSWVHVKDLASMFLFCATQGLNGVYNGVAPNPVSNGKMVKEMALLLKKPLWLPNIPAAFLKLLLGEMSNVLLASQRVSSKKIEEEGFRFQFTSLQPALVNLLVQKNQPVEELV